MSYGRDRRDDEDRALHAQSSSPGMTKPKPKKVAPDEAGASAAAGPEGDAGPAPAAPIAPEPATCEEIFEAWTPEQRMVRLKAGKTVKTLRFQAIGRKRWEGLVAEHRPTDAQKAEFRQDQLDRGVAPGMLKVLGWNVETFPIEAIAACLVEPELTVVDVRRLWDDDTWSSAELGELFAAAVLCNTSSTRVRIDRKADFAALLDVAT